MDALLGDRDPIADYAPLMVSCPQANFAPYARLDPQLKPVFALTH